MTPLEQLRELLKEPIKDIDVRNAAWHVVEQWGVSQIEKAASLRAEELKEQWLKAHFPAAVIKELESKQEV